MKNNIEKLRSQCKKANDRYRKLKDKIDELETKAALPKLKKQYEGKFWKFRNSTGPDDWWWYYSYCREVVDTHTALCDSFETTPYSNEFKSNSNHHFHLFQTEITKQEYMEALTTFLSRCQNMIDNAFNANE